MEKYTIFKYKKTHYCENVNSPQMMCILSAIPIKISADIFKNQNWQGDFKIYLEMQKSGIEKKSKVGRLTLYDFKIYYIATIMKTV